MILLVCTLCSQLSFDHTTWRCARAGSIVFSFMHSMQKKLVGLVIQHVADVCCISHVNSK